MIQIITYILDDEPVIAEYTEKFLNKDNSLSISSFTNPIDFLKAINNGVHLVLLDIRIPGHDYNVFNMIEFLQKEYPGLYIIVISGFLEIDAMKIFLRFGVFDVVEKGGSINWMDELNEALERVKRQIIFKLQAIKSTENVS